MPLGMDLGAMHFMRVHQRLKSETVSDLEIDVSAGRGAWYETSVDSLIRPSYFAKLL